MLIVMTLRAPGLADSINILSGREASAMGIVTGGPDINGPGVSGTGFSIPGISQPGVFGIAGTSPPSPIPGVSIGVKGDGGTGGPSLVPGLPGVRGIGVLGTTTDAEGYGVWGQNTSHGDGVFGTGAGNGVHGQSASATDSGVWGENTGAGVGVAGSAVRGDGVFGTSQTNGIHGRSASATDSGVWGENTGAGFGVAGSSISGPGVLGQSQTGNAGEFRGNVSVQGDLNVTGDVLLVNRDICERFAAAPADFEPGMVMVMGGDGLLAPCTRAYDRAVVGVISGAGTLRPAITLGQGQDNNPNVPIALVGTAYCMADADQGEIQIGDLLTSAPTRGHAMKVTDWPLSHGTVIGKALAPLDRGRGLIPIVISLQ